jgi:hypothetical protein
MEPIYAVLFDAISIQKYVFSGNKLQENIGASRIVEDIYGALLQESVENILGHPVNFACWKNRTEQDICNNGDDFEVGYIGGGNALLFFKDESRARAVVKDWTRKLLIEAPGIRTAAAVASFSLDNYKEAIETLFKLLEQNKNQCLPQTVPAKHGITADCPLSGLSADVYHVGDDINRYISAATEAKLRMADKEKFSQYVDDLLNSKYTFIKNVNELGQQEGENYLAIVHIDGNSFGKFFDSCTSLAETRQRSVDVKKAMETAFAGMIKFIIDHIDKFTEENGFELKVIDNRKVLPFRPLLLGGDDFTFVADGRLGVPLAEVFLSHLAKEEVSGKRLSACAGVAITKTKHPFFRGYVLAKALCDNAKNFARKKPKNSSWLDFYLAYGGFSGSLGKIRTEHYTTQDTMDNRLYFGPYLVTPKDIGERKAIIHLKEGMNLLSNRKIWPSSKVMEFREALTLGQEATKQFLSAMNLRHTCNNTSKWLYEYPHDRYHLNGFIYQEIPYFDQIELLDFYPEFLRKEKVSP